MLIFAIDIGTRCGIAAGISGVSIDVTAFEAEPGNHPGQRYKNFADVLNRLIDRVLFRYGRKPDYLVYENIRSHPSTWAKKDTSKKGPRGTNIDAAHLWGAFRCLIEQEAYCWQIPVLKFEQAHIKKIATGKGNAKKEEVLAAMRRKFPGIEIAGFDEADAVAVWLTACKYINA